MLEGAHRLLGEARRLVDDGERIARGEVAGLRVGFVGTALYSLLPAVLREARRRYPELRLVLEEHKTAAQVRALQLGRLDIGLVHLPLGPGAGLATVATTTDPVGLALPADHRLSDAPTIELAQVAGDPFVLFPRELEPQTYDRYVEACVEAGFARTWRSRRPACRRSSAWSRPVWASPSWPPPWLATSPAPAWCSGPSRGRRRR